MMFNPRLPGLCLDTWLGSPEHLMYALAIKTKLLCTGSIAFLFLCCRLLILFQNRLFLRVISEISSAFQQFVSRSGLTCVQTVCKDKWKQPRHVKMVQTSNPDRWKCFLMSNLKIELKFR